MIQFGNSFGIRIGPTKQVTLNVKLYRNSVRIGFVVARLSVGNKKLGVSCRLVFNFLKPIQG